MQNEQVNDLKEFIRQHRTNEANFTTLLQKLDEEITNNQVNEEYHQALRDIKNKQAEEYLTARQKGGSTWPEFENFVSAFEKALV